MTDVMKDIKTAAAALIMAAVCLTAAGCAKDKGSSGESSSQESSPGASSAAEDTSAGQDSSSAESDGSRQRNVMGDKILKAAAFFDKANYEYVCTVKGSGRDATITLVKNQGIISQTTDYGDVKAYIVCSGDQTFRYDTLTKTYAKDVGTIVSDPSGNLIVQTVKKGLERTHTHIDSQEEKKYDCEEYTYTGQTYITVLDFYFDKITGDLRKYTVTYSVEGRDNEVETREIVKMSDTSVSDVTFDERRLTREGYAAFGAMTDSQREEYFKKLMETCKLSNDDLYAVGFTPYEFKTASYSEISAAFIAASKKD